MIRLNKAMLVAGHTAGLIAAGLVIASGCGTGGFDTATKLAEALENEGIEYESVGEVKRGGKRVPRFIDEAISLTGEGLRVEIFRVENEKYFKMAAAAVWLRRGVEAQVDGDPDEEIEDAFIRRPFVVAIIREPEQGLVKQTLERILPKGKE